LKKKVNFLIFNILILLLVSFKGIAQVPVAKKDSIPKGKAFNLDSLKQSKSIFKIDSNTLKKRILMKKNVKDTFPKIFGAKPFLEKEKPRIVFLRSLILPGWGQISNKQYYKLPLIYGAAGAGGYFIYLNNKKCTLYVDYLKAMVDKKTTETVVYFNGSTILSPKDKSINSTTEKRGPFSKDLINNSAKQYRRWKQGTIIGFSAGWLLFAIDANVAAHLKSFDMTDNISATLKPSIINIQGSTAAGLTLKLNLN
jgi:Family of unknown function (DUF5683)